MVKRGIGVVISAFLIVFLAEGAPYFATPHQYPSEQKLAGLRPGKDAVQRAHRRFGKGGAIRLSARSFAWVSSCNREQVAIDLASNDSIDQITVGPRRVTSRLFVAPDPILEQCGLGTGPLVACFCETGASEFRNFTAPRPQTKASTPRMGNYIL